MKYERICVVDKKHYSYCPNCREFDHLPKWHTIYCSENCRNIFNACSKLHYDNFDAKETYELLMKCDLSKQEELSLPLQEDIAAIYSAYAKYLEENTESEEEKPKRKRTKENKED